MKRLYPCQDKTIGFIKKLWLLATFLVFSLQANAQCPPGNVQLHSQYDLEMFWMQYPNCTHIPGTLQLGNLNADYDLDDFSIINFLGHLQSVGGLKIYRTGLTNLNGLSNLTSINGVLDIRSNSYLLNISGLQNVNPNGITSLNIQSNFSLNSCNISTVCEYLKGSGSVTITNNAGCHSVAQVAQSCPCDAPQVPGMLSSITPTKATIHWSGPASTYNIQWGLSGFAIGTGTIQNGVTGASYQITGLTPGTTYDVYIRQNCSFNQSAWVKRTFTTPEACPTETVYLNTQADVNNFGMNYPECESLNHRLILGNNGPNDIHDLSPLSGIKNLYNELHIYSTQLTDLNDLNLSVVSYRLQISNNNLLTDISALENVGGSLFNLTITSNPNLSNCNISRICTALTNSNVDKTIQGNGVGCQSYTDVYTACYPCSVSPSNITSTNVLSDKATINWTSTGSSFDLEWGVEGFAQGTGTAQNGVSALNYQLTGLSPATTYDFYVRRNCGSEQSSWVKYTFSTISTCPSGAVLLTSQADVNNFLATYPNCTQIAGQLKLGDFSTPNDITNLSPLSNIQSINGDLIIYSTQLTNLNSLSAITSISGNLDITRNSNLTDISGVQQIDPAGITYLFIEQNANLSACNIAPVCNYLQGSGDRLILANATGCDSVEAIAFSCLPPCEVPASITSSNITSDKARINWTNSGTFDLEWGIAGFAQGTGTVENGVSALNYTLTNLTELTSYDVYVRQNCTVNQSGWVKHTFSTISICPSGNILLRTQQEVNAFGAMYPNCTEISGAMTINNTNDISNLSPLGNITSIGGFLVINNTYSGFYGLSSLTSVGSYLTISSNHNLYNLNQLSSLASINGDLQIQNNGNLNNISGLQHLSGITNLIITNNQSLSSCNIESVCNYLNGVGYYYSQISGNAQGCESKATVKAACPAAPQLECPTGDIWLNSQHAVYEFSLYNCTVIEGNLAIEGNVTDLSALNSIETITGDLTISSTAQLTSLNGLSSLASIGGTLYVGFNHQLTNLDGLSSLTNIGAFLSIQNNPQLADISGLSSISGITDLYILSNPMLSSCSIASICSYLQGGGSSYFYENGANCGNATTVIANCPLPCQDLTTISSSRVSYKAARINWESESGTYSLEYGLEGFQQGTGTLVQNITTPYHDLTNLSETTTYDVYIKKYCEVNEADWVKYTFTTNKVCPDINTSFYFSTQDEVDEFAYTYPDCTQILGHVGINGAGITNLTALSNIQNILWGISIQGTSLTSLNDLSSLTSVGGTYISNSFNASFIIGENPLLTDISILDNIDTPHFNRIDIVDNTSLEVCNYPIICNFLGAEDKTIRVSGNDQGCENKIRLYNICGYQCPPTSLEFNTQAEVNSFGTYFSECTHINGSLSILYEVEDLTPLSNIESIQGGLSVDGTQLTNLNNLSSLTSIGGLSLGYNNLLTDVSALENVTINPAGDLYVTYNPSLSVCNISSICTYLQQSTGNKVIEENASGCQDLSALYASCGITLECPPGDITLMSQQDIADFAATYPNCTQIQGNLLIGSEEQTDITDLSPLSNLEIISGGFVILGSQVTNLNGLSSLTSVGALILVNNPLLNNISALENAVVSLEGELSIVGNPSLSVCGISSICNYLQQTPGYGSIENNAPGCEDHQAIITSCPLPECPSGDITLLTQEEVDAFGAMYPNCTQINGNLEITSSWQNEDVITDLSPLSNIQTIQGGFLIYETSLTHLNALSNLTAVNGAWFSISDNSLLEDVSGLSNVNLNSLNPIDMEYDGFYIGYNPLLSVCNVPNFCSYLSNDPATHPRHIENNAPGCEDNDAIAAACLEPFPCLPPVALAALPTNESATISWSSMGTSFDIEWGLSDFTQGEGLGSQNNISELNFALSGLSTETSYDVYVRTNCENGQSNWVKYTFSTLSVCPSGDITLPSQQEIDAFGAMYPNCTQIQGNLQIGVMGDESGINDLSPLSNLQGIQGGLIISGTSLTNLDAISNLTAVNGMILAIYGNSLLEDISGLTNVALNPTAMQGQGLFIGFNPLLSVCNIPPFCEYLADPNNPRSITDNAGDCVSADAVLNKCFAGNCESYTIWDGNSWSNGTPDHTKRIIVRNDLTISSDMTACELLLQAGIVNVNSGTTFTVAGEIHNTLSATNFIVESDANLIQLDDVENIGAITVKRNSFPLYRQDYTLWSSPVGAQNLRNFSPQTVFSRFYSYDTAAGTAGEYEQELFTTADTQTKTFAVAKGYMIRMPNNWPEFENENIAGTPFAGSFAGIPNNGNITIPISTANTGVNLVGNPYPSSLAIDAFFDANPAIDQTLYFWRKRNGVAGSGYATYTALGLQSPEPEINGLDLNNMIKPGQGFFVKTTGPTQLYFNNQMRSGGQNGHFLRTNASEKHRFWLNLSNTTDLIGQTLIGYTTGATQGNDSGLDGVYFNDSTTALTSLIDAQEFAIQARSIPFNASDIVSLGFKTSIGGNYKISLSSFDGLFEGNQDIFLKDNSTGLQHNLKLSDYEFTTSEGIFNDRFQIVYQSILGVENPDVTTNNIVLYRQNNTIHINSGINTMQKIELFDIRGRLIHTQNGINNTTTQIDQLTISNQVLLVKIHLEDNREEIRKIIY